VAIGVDSAGRWIDNVFITRLWFKYGEVYLRKSALGQLHISARRQIYKVSKGTICPGLPFVFGY
jgi:hypothetical protein